MLELIGIVLFAVGLLLSIALHEVGHLVPAKRFGVKVTQYMVGFGPTLWSRRRGETEYGIKAIPMGGYIRMVGMFPPGSGRRQGSGRMGTLVERARAEALSEVAAGEEVRAFYALSAPRKLAIMAGGPLMNLVVAVILFVLSFSVLGFAAPTTTVRALVPCVPTVANPSGIASTDGGCGGGPVSPSVSAGVRAGDRVVAVGGTSIRDWVDIGDALTGRSGSEVAISVERDGATLEVTALVTSITGSDGAPRAFLGISPSFALTTLPVAGALGEMGQMGAASVRHLASFPAQVGHLAVTMLTGQERDPQGPVSVIGVGRISGEIAAQPGVAARDKASSYLSLLASLNLFLFVFNMVPLLPLDGGHIAGALYEGARRTVSRWRGRGATGPVDTALMLPVAYAVSVALLLMSLVVMVSDIVNPITLR